MPILSSFPLPALSRDQPSPGVPDQAAAFAALSGQPGRIEGMRYARSGAGTRPDGLRERLDDCRATCFTEIARPVCRTTTALSLLGMICGAGAGRCAEGSSPMVGIGCLAGAAVAQIYETAKVCFEG